VQTDVWSSLTHDPRDPRYAGLRASDADRATVQQVLDEAYADGRLDREEHSQRTDRVAACRMLGDVPPLLADLVALTPATTTPLARASRTELERIAVDEWRHKRRDAAFSFVGFSAVTSTIWFATCFGGGDFDPYFFWPAFPIVFALLNLLRTTFDRSEIVASEIRKLERKQAKDLRRQGRPW
jgi:hypothetical protein